jgi:hypothetical protein
VVNLLQDANPLSSPWFTLPVGTGTTVFGAATDNNGASNLSQSISIKPQTSVRAGEVNSLTTHGNFILTGTATAAGSFVDGNGIPAGVVVRFQTDTTFTANAGSFLTLTGPTQANGLGITPTQTTSGTIDVGETLTVSDFTVTSLTFTGAPKDPVVFTAPTVGSFAPYVIRTAGNAVDGLDELTENAGLFSIPPDPSGKPTIGFGNGTPGEGTAASHLAMENGFGAQTGTNGSGNTFAGLGPVGGFTLQMGAGAIAIKGIGYQYQVGYTLLPAPTGDYNHNGVVDAVDYLLWRKGVAAADGNSDTVVDQADYDLWRANFGTAAAGAGAGLSGSSVPEPTSLVLLIVGSIVGCVCRRSRQA